MKIPKEFRGLVFAPSTESELGILFGMLLPYLNPPMCVVEGEFQVSQSSWPDLKVKILENKKWKSCRIEFEVKSATFIKHKHNPSDYDKIICWEDNWHTLSEKDKKKYKKFCNAGNRISLKETLQKNERLRTRAFILNADISSKSNYKNVFAKITRHLNSFKALKKRVARDYVSYLKNNITFILLKLEGGKDVTVYIANRAIATLKNSEQFANDMGALNPKITESLKDMSLTISSSQEADEFINILTRHLSV